LLKWQILKAVKGSFDIQMKYYTSMQSVGSYFLSFMCWAEDHRTKTGDQSQISSIWTGDISANQMNEI
jgi:hypothetical protein